jgi:hypothetical protein
LVIKTKKIFALSAQGHAPHTVAGAALGTTGLDKQAESQKTN